MNTTKNKILRAFQGFPLMDDFRNYKLVVYTSSGVFIGTPVLPVLKESAESTQATAIMSSLVTTALEDCVKNDSTYEYLILSDVTFTNGSFHQSLPVVTIFFDQIAGISFGDAIR